MALAEVGGCIYDTDQLRLSHGFEGLDPVGREAFVNHWHLTATDRVAAAEQIIQSWVAEMRARWPGHAFRIYRQVDDGEVMIRFHEVRTDVPNWCEDNIEVVVIGSQDAEPSVTPDCGGIM